MVTEGKPPYPEEIADFEPSGFQLKEHLQQFLGIDPETLTQCLNAGQANLKILGNQAFDWIKTTEFYKEHVNESYLFELGAWHLSSQDYIGETLYLVSDFARGTVLDFGGGIGTHTIAAARSPRVEAVIYCDLNPINRQFVTHRARQLGLAEKISCLETVNDTEFKNSFDCVLAFDVLEHLLNPAQQLIQFHTMLKSDGVAILNWYFFKGFKDEFPFHLDDPASVAVFFQTLQKNFIEIFHPYYITTRCYNPLRS